MSYMRKRDESAQQLPVAQSNCLKLFYDEKKKPEIKPSRRRVDVPLPTIFHKKHAI